MTKVDLDPGTLEKARIRHDPPLEPRAKSETGADVDVVRSLIRLRGANPVTQVLAPDFDKSLLGPKSPASLPLARQLGRRLHHAGGVEEARFKDLMDLFSEEAAADKPHFLRLVLEFGLGTMEAGKPIGKRWAMLAIVSVHLKTLEAEDLFMQKGIVDSYVTRSTSGHFRYCSDDALARVLRAVSDIWYNQLDEAASNFALAAAALTHAAEPEYEDEPAGVEEPLPTDPSHDSGFLRNLAIRLLRRDLPVWAYDSEDVDLAEWLTPLPPNPK